MITLIGTGHVFNLSEALENIFDEKQPDIICVELDRQRYNALQLKKTNPQALKQSQQQLPLIYKILGRFQDSMASEYGVVAGDEMMTAISYAQSHAIPAELIDTNAQQLFINMWKNMPITEKLKLILSGFTGLFISKKQVEEELKSFQKDSDKYINEIGRRFPTIKKTLIDDRNEHMAKKIIQLTENYQSILVCVGDGHIPGLSQILKENNIEFEVIRLGDLINRPAKDTDASNAHFSTRYSPPQS